MSSNARILDVVDFLPFDYSCKFIHIYWMYNSRAYSVGSDRAPTLECSVLSRKCAAITATQSADHQRRRGVSVLAKAIDPVPNKQTSTRELQDRLDDSPLQQTFTSV